jgi:hypothetical protein
VVALRGATSFEAQQKCLRGHRYHRQDPDRGENMFSHPLRFLNSAIDLAELRSPVQPLSAQLATLAAGIVLNDCPPTRSSSVWLVFLTVPVDSVLEM